jgi:release factor glutamine methyltransferase
MPLSQTANAPTVGRVLQRAIAALAGASPSARLDAEVLVMQVCGLTRAQLLTRADRPLPAAQRARIEALVARRRGGEPIAYLTGEREFWSMAFKVTPDVLIPRPETELLVERALARLPADAAWTLADLGTGCGAVALAIARERRRARVLATDRSAAALEVARANAARLGLARIEFRHGEWCTPLAGERPDLIVSNPPYVRADDPHLGEGDLRYEPRTALDGGRDGLDAIRAIARGARERLRPGGWLLLEHGYDQAEAVAQILRSEGYREIAGHRDLAGRPRVSEARAP